MKKKKTGHLFRQAIVGLTLISIFPVLLVGWQIIKMNNRALQHQMWDKQYALASHMAFYITGTIKRQEQLLFAVERTQTTKPDAPAPLSLQDLRYPLHFTEALLTAAILETDGKILFLSKEDPALDKQLITQVIQQCKEEETAFVREVSPQDPSLIWVAVGLTHTDSKFENKIWLGKMDLQAVDDMLNQVGAVKNVSLAITSPQGVFVSLKRDASSLVLSEDKKFEETLPLIQQQLGTDHYKQIKLKNEKKKYIVSRVYIPQTEWQVYVYQYLDSSLALFWNSLKTMGWEIGTIFLVMLLFEIAVVYWVISPIALPLRRLKEVTTRLEKEENYRPTEKDLLIPNNEIGEFEKVFLRLIDILFERTQDLKKATEKMADVNQELEERVKQRTLELDAATEKLVAAERLAAIGKMSSIVSHEIRNPLAVIRNAVQLIKIIQPPVEPKAIKQFSIIESEIRHADGIIGEVLGFVRHRNMLLSRVDLNSYLHDMLASFPPVHDVRIVEELDAENVQLKIDTEEMKQALRNLISNACEAMPGGGVVTVGTKVGKEAVCIYIADEGPGIPENIRETMFLPFYTTKARGTGLGLAIVRKAINRHKGKIFVGNRKPKGTIFAVYLHIHKKEGEAQYG